MGQRTIREEQPRQGRRRVAGEPVGISFSYAPGGAAVHFCLVTHGFALPGFTVGYFPAPLPGLRAVNETRLGLGAFAK